MLNYQDLYKGFIDIFDKPNEYTENLQVVCQRWTNVFEVFYLNQIMPILGAANSNLYPSLQIFKNNLLGIIKSQTWHIQFEVLVQNLHLGVCMGVNMTGIYTTTPPSIPLRLQHCWKSNLSTKTIASMLASTIFSWIQLTFSIQNTSGAIIKWM